jgi:hypothetical protein
MYIATGAAAALVHLAKFAHLPDNAVFFKRAPEHRDISADASLEPDLPLNR